MARYCAARPNTPVEGIEIRNNNNRSNTNARLSHDSGGSDLPNKVERTHISCGHTTPQAQVFANPDPSAVNTPTTPLTPTSDQPEIESDLPSAGFSGPDFEFGQPSNSGRQSLQDPIVSNDNKCVMIFDHFGNSQILPLDPQIGSTCQVSERYYQAGVNVEMANNPWNRPAGFPGYGSGGSGNNQFIPLPAAQSMGNNRIIANQYGIPTAVTSFGNNQFVVNQSAIPSGANAIDYSFDVNNPPPFVDLTRFAWPSNGPVVRINNIPFNVTKDEVKQFMKRTLLPHSGDDNTFIVAIHIVMERTNAKTQDCFIELDHEDTMKVVMARYNSMLQSSRPPKMGTRHISVEASNQGGLMKELFPRAHCIRWDDACGVPVRTVNDDFYSSGFRGFNTSEELFMLVKYTIDPERNPYNGKCLQRTFETMMTILQKFPWATTYHTLEDRDKLWSAYYEQLVYLFRKVNSNVFNPMRDERTVGLDTRLLKAFVTAGIDCPAFVEWQKFDILDVVGYEKAEYGVSSMGTTWPFETLNKAPGVGDQELQMWLDLMNSGAQDELQTLPHTSFSQKYLKVAMGIHGGVFFEVNKQFRKYGYRDLARKEYNLMWLLVKKGWDKWFRARGMDVGNIHDAPEYTRQDMALKALLLKLGVFSRDGILPLEPQFKHFLPKLGDLREMRDPSLRLVNMEEEREWAGEPTSTLGADDSPGGLRVEFRNPFHGPNQGNVSSIVFGQLQKDTEVPAKTPTRTRTGKAIAIKKPGDQAEVVFSPELRRDTDLEGQVSPNTKSDKGKAKAAEVVDNTDKESAEGEEVIVMSGGRRDISSRSV